MYAKLLLSRKNNYYIFCVYVCCLSYPECKAHELCYIAICGPSATTIRFHLKSHTSPFSGGEGGGVMGVELLNIKCVCCAITLYLKQFRFLEELRDALR